MSAKITFIDKDIDFIIKTFPKSMKALRDYMQEMFKQSAQEGTPVQEVTQEVVNGLLFFAPRHLYDFFDDMKITTAVMPEEDGWCSEVDGNAVFGHEHRLMAEKTAFVDGFKKLESTL